MSPGMPGGGFSRIYTILEGQTLNETTGTEADFAEYTRYYIPSDFKMEEPVLAYDPYVDVMKSALQTIHLWNDLERFIPSDRVLFDKWNALYTAVNLLYPSKISQQVNPEAEDKLTTALDEFYDEFAADIEAFEQEYSLYEDMFYGFDLEKHPDDLASSGTSVIGDQFMYYTDRFSEWMHVLIESNESAKEDRK